MIALALSALLLPQQAGELFSSERWDNAGDELPPGLDWYVGGAASLGDVDGDGVDDLAVWVADVAFDFSLVLLFLREKHRRTKLLRECLQCGHDLSGSAARTCPACGAPT